MDSLAMMSFCERLMTPTKPRRSGMMRPRSISSASVPWSIRSSLVSTPTVRTPSGSTSLAICSASEFARSVFAAVTARMMHDSSLMKLSTMFRIKRSMSGGWSPTGTRVIPGRSTSVRFSTLAEYTFRLMGLSEMPLFVPVSASVAASISARTLSKSVNLTPGLCRNSAQSSPESGVLISWRTSGRRVTMPLPRGRKSRPTMFSNTELLPLDWPPTTAI
mmetsp:Transcript_21622/g.69619  ORF Transcript_21622/g.69619 Transcript_21622/m.69619 type:complete len:219 (-) Transcript_21622:130-786(-)